MKLLAGLLLLAAACTPDFQSRSQVVDLRILAVQAEPPEAHFDPASGAVEPVRITVLAVDGADRDAPADLDASVCAPTDSGVCDEGPSLPQDPLHRDGGDAFATTLRVPQSAVLAAADAGALGDLNGIRVQYSFSVTDTRDDAGPQTGEKIVIYSPDGGPPPNRNPIMAGAAFVFIQPDGGTDPDAGVFLTDGQTLSAVRERDIGITPDLPADQVETYATTDLRGNRITLPEFPAYAFYMTGNAEFDNDTADQPLDGGAAPPQGLTRFTAHGDGGTIWIVVRDGRGGESWLTFPWSAGP